VTFVQLSTTADDPTWSSGVDPSIPSPARMYDYYLGGKDHFPADRAAAEKALSVVPHGRELARSNRRFLVRAVRHMARHGVAQFIDLGTGYPTSPSVHEAAAALVDRPRVVYVDNDALVTAHNRALLGGREGVTVLHGDIRCPGQIFKQDELWQAIDFDRAVGILFVAVLHFIPDEDDPQSSVNAFCGHMAPGGHGNDPRCVPDCQCACGVPQPGRDSGVLRRPGPSPSRACRGVRVARERESAVDAAVPRRSREETVSRATRTTPLTYHVMVWQTFGT
jgi:hypothetical protein